MVGYCSYGISVIAWNWHTIPVDELLMHLYHHQELQELKCLYQAIKSDFEIYGEGVKPLKATGTRRFDHRIRAMGRLVHKVGLYARHMKEFIDKEKNSKTKAIVND